MENKIKGGKADGMTIEDIAKKHKVSVASIKKQIEMGLKIEREHTTDPEEAKEISMDHLVEFPDYYDRLDKMEKEASKKQETKEQTMSDSSGAFEAPIFGKTILKKDIHKIPNFKLAEQMDSSVSAGAQYDGPIGTNGPSSPMDHKKKKRKDPLALDEKGESTRTASITAASTPDMISTKKGFPRFGGPGAKFVEIDKKCKKFPYCNQGAGGNKLKFVNEELEEAINEASKKYGITVKEVKKMVSEALPVGMLDDPGNKKAMKSWVDKVEKTKFRITTKHPIDIITDDEVELARLKMIFYNHDIHFHENEIKK